MMADIEKVKKALECCKSKSCIYESAKDCPYIEWQGEWENFGYECTKMLADNAIEVIAELEERIAIMQEPVEKKWYPKIRMWECQGCGDVVRGIDKYCSHCGRKFIDEEGEQG